MIESVQTVPLLGQAWRTFQDCTSVSISSYWISIILSVFTLGLAVFYSPSFPGFCSVCIRSACRRGKPHPVTLSLALRHRWHYWGTTSNDIWRQIWSICGQNCLKTDITHFKCQTTLYYAEMLFPLRTLLHNVKISWLKNGKNSNTFTTLELGWAI